MSRICIWFSLAAMLSACAGRTGCVGNACERPDSTDRQLVVWWAPDMRQGVNDSDSDVDFTVVPLRN